MNMNKMEKMRTLCSAALAKIDAVEDEKAYDDIVAAQDEMSEVVRVLRYDVRQPLRELNTRLYIDATDGDGRTDAESVRAFITNVLEAIEVLVGEIVREELKS